MKILIAALVESEWLHAGVAGMLCELTAKYGKKLDIIFPRMRPIDHARNKIVEYAIDRGYDNLLMIDDDNPCPGDPLIHAGKHDVVFFPTPMDKGGKIQMNVKTEKWEGLVEVERGGTGCFLISRRVMMEIPKPLFQTLYDENGFVIQGEDYFFSEKAKQYGFTLYADFDRKCNHYQQINLWNYIAARNELGEHNEDVTIPIR